MKNDNIRFEIIKPIAVLSTREDMTKEANFVSWNYEKPVIDVRYWNTDHTTMSNGITFNETEILTLFKGVKKWTEENKK